MSPKVVTPTIEETVALLAGRVRHLESLEHGIEPFSAHPDNPTAHVYHNANYSYPNTTWQNMPFNSEYFDNDGIHDNAINNDRLTCQTPGRYLIIANLCWETDPNGTRIMQLYHSVDGMLGRDLRDALATQQCNMHIAVEWRMLQGRYLFLNLWQNSGGALNILSVDKRSPRFIMIRTG